MKFNKYVLYNGQLFIFLATSVLFSTTIFPDQLVDINYRSLEKTKQEFHQSNKKLLIKISNTGSQPNFNKHILDKFILEHLSNDSTSVEVLPFSKIIQQLDSQFNIMNFNTVQIELDWSLDKPEIGADLVEVNHIRINGLGSIGNNDDKKIGSLISIVADIKSYLDDLILKPAYNPEFKQSRNTIYDVNFLLDDDLFQDLSNTKSKISSIKECIVDTLTNSHDKFLKGQSNRIINIKYKENPFTSYSQTDTRKIDFLGDSDDFYRTYSSSIKLFQLYQPIVYNNARSKKQKESYFRRGENVRILGIELEDSCQDLIPKLQSLLFEIYDLKKAYQILEPRKTLEYKSSEMVGNVLMYMKFKHALKEASVTIDSLEYIRKNWNLLFRTDKISNINDRMLDLKKLSKEDLFFKKENLVQNNKKLAIQESFNSMQNEAIFNDNYIYEEFIFGYLITMFLPQIVPFTKILKHLAVNKWFFKENKASSNAFGVVMGLDSIALSDFFDDKDNLELQIV